MEKIGKDYYCKRKKRFYVNRTIGSDCYYCVVDGNIDASAAAGKETGKNSNVPG